MTQVIRNTTAGYGPRIVINNDSGHQVFAMNRNNHDNGLADAKRVTYHITTTGGGSVALTKEDLLEVFSAFIDMVDDTEWKQANG